MTKKLRPYQQEMKSGIYQAWEDGHKNVLCVMPTGGGKCLGVDTPVLLHDGSILKVQDVKSGDLLMGPDSKPRRVLSTCKGQSDLYKVTPLKGDSWVCNDVHVLSLVHSQTSATIDIQLDEYLKKSKNFKHLHKQFRVGVEFPSREVPFDPYFLGLFLAEGTYCRPHITNPDKEIIEYLRSWSNTNGMKMSEAEGQGCASIGFADIKQGWNKNKVTRMAKTCTSKENRWIPNEFLINSEEVRLKLLAGLLDGDGYLHHNNFEIITKYPSLNDDILYLARSLGFAAYSHRTVKKIKSLDFQGEYFRISISGDTDRIPNIVARKKAHPRKQIKDVLRVGFSVDEIGRGDYYGFTLDGDGRFLLGDFTVTHNTVTFCSIAIDMAVTATDKSPTAIMVHRKELVSQICLTLAEEGINHNIIAPRPVILGIVAAQRQLLKKQHYDYNAPVTVISVDTLNARILKHEKWAKGIKLWITDEAAHLLKENKWGRAVKYFPNARGLGVTATPERLDKRGLGSHVDGVFDTMVEGPNTKWMIDNGFLCKYKIVIPESDYRLHLKESSGDGDYSKEAMIVASQKSHIVGDVVKNYIKFAKGKQAIVFASDIGAGNRMEKEFVDAGITAKILTGITDDSVRLKSLIEYRDKNIQVLINVDLFDEGLDVPGIECVIMARPTKSLGKYLQMVGRGLRIAKGKPFLILVDHVGNVKEHGLPDSRRKWTLDRITKRKKKLNLIRICRNWECNSPFDRILTECPYCGLKDEPKKPGDGGGRVSPKTVDGDLVMLDPDTLRELEANTKLESPASLASRVERAAGAPAGKRAMSNQIERIETQKKLAEVVAKWAGVMRHRQGLSDRQIHKQFFIDYDETISEILAKPKAEMIWYIEELEGKL